MLSTFKNKDEKKNEEKNRVMTIGEQEMVVETWKFTLATTATSDEWMSKSRRPKKTGFHRVASHQTIILFGNSTLRRWTKRKMWNLPNKKKNTITKKRGDKGCWFDRFKFTF